MEPYLPALSFYFGLSPDDVWGLTWPVLSRYLEFLDALGGDADA